MRYFLYILTSHLVCPYWEKIKASPAQLGNQSGQRSSRGSPANAKHHFPAAPQPRRPATQLEESQPWQVRRYFHLTEEGMLVHPFHPSPAEKLLKTGVSWFFSSGTLNLNGISCSFVFNCRKQEICSQTCSPQPRSEITFPDLSQSPFFFCSPLPNN